MAPTNDRPSRRDHAPRGPHIPDLRLRLAGPADRDLLFVWANDAVTRAASFHTDRIEQATHDAWFAQRMTMPHGRIWIGEVGGRPIGQVRVDRSEEGNGEIGISLAPEMRGRGLARALLLAGMAAAERELGSTTFVALVRPENAASLALFRGAGFRDVADDGRAGLSAVILALPKDPLDSVR